MPRPMPLSERSFEEMQAARVDEKARIGELAASLVSQGETVILDVGTTTTAVARALANRLDLLVGGATNTPSRQQTLRGTIDWSYHLLDAAGQRLFTRLGVFSHGWTLEAVAPV